ncbi:XLF-domain-containing protein [Pleomassaria siparia CBS 279.74]|uniref:Non-homologous end-joining factor 1 n=1 Tax=Pleomassaria siparia CBS 279.74 TaxID=1314801 RepID=A0A6G1K6T8_9PLEO|nr:XLF-domain-containing protein [Pleomassaria siparia CBS 279.74]
MGCWRVLELSDAPSGPDIPQLLIKTAFGFKTYTVFLTDLNNIWSEELDFSAIVERASQQKSPIEVSKQDTTQLAILLEHVQISLTSADDTTCRITRDDTDGVVLNATARLPAPLDSLRWKFYLEKRTTITLRNELILPLLVSSHIQHERISSLVTSVTEKDKAITKLLDSFESSNLDLSTAFPSISGSKPGRRPIKREQAARYVPALQPFHEDSWKEETGELRDSRISTLALFQEALSQSNPKVPSRMKAKEEEDTWWKSIGSAPNSPEHKEKFRTVKAKSPATPHSEPSDDETEDEFETHENFNVQLRASPKKPTMLPEPTPPLVQKAKAESEDESTEDEEDLDAPPKSQSQSQARTSHRSPTTKAESSDSEPCHPPKPSSSTGVKPKGFRIGGAKLKKAVVDSPAHIASPERDRADHDNGDDANPPEASIPTRERTSTEPQIPVQVIRKPFRIGGKHKASDENTGASSEQSATTKPRSALPNLKTEAGTDSPTEEREETAEEKAERKRRELKRKNEELAKKQAQKKKKRF